MKIKKIVITRRAVDPLFALRYYAPANHTDIINGMKSISEQLFGPISFGKLNKSIFIK